MFVGAEAEGVGSMMGGLGAQERETAPMDGMEAVWCMNCGECVSFVGLAEEHKGIWYSRSRRRSAP